MHVVVFPAGFLYDENPPVAGECTPCHQIFCQTTEGTPFYPRQHQCFREGCQHIVDSACPAVPFCSETCFRECCMNERWTVSVLEFAKPITAPTPTTAPPPFPTFKVARYLNFKTAQQIEEQKKKRKERNRKYYEKIKQSGKAEQYHQVFIQKRREKQQAAKAAANDSPEDGFPTK